MSEKLFPLDVPPGLSHNGTKTQAAGRWYDGNQVRFFEGTILPIGGFAQLPTTGATIAGTPNAALSMTKNDGTAYLIIGTTTGLYVMSASFVVNDITPVTGLGGTPYHWQLANFGSYVIACHEAPASLAAGTGSPIFDGITVYAWTGNPATRAAVAQNTTTLSSSLTAPTAPYGIVVTPERFLFLLRGSDPVHLTSPPDNIVDGGTIVGVPFPNYSTRRLYWASQETLMDYIPTDVNTAGSFDIATDGALVTGLPARGETLIWSTTDLWSATYIGAPFYYSFERKGQHCGIISSHAAVVLDSGAYWMGPGNRFYHYDHTVRVIDCDVADYLTATMGSNVSAIFAYANPLFSEITWFYPNVSNSNTLYVTYNYKENHWVYGTMNARSAGVTSMPGFVNTPLLILETGAVSLHEFGQSSRSNCFLESGPLKIGEGDNVVRVQRIVPDDKTLGDVNATLFAAIYPDAAETSQGPVSLASPTSVRLTGRQFRLRLQEVAATAWRIGKVQLGGILGGKR